MFMLSYRYVYVILLLCPVLYILFSLSFSVLFVCICVPYYCHRVSTQLQLTNISYHIIYYIISYIKRWRTCNQRPKTAPLGRRTTECHTSIRFSMYLGSEVPSEEDYNNTLSLKKNKLGFVNDKFLLVLANTHKSPPPPDPSSFSYT
jgi:hypothetical protein